jgi:hypothetical protein
MKAASILSMIGPAGAKAWFGHEGERPGGLVVPALAAACAAGVLLALSYAQKPFWWAAWLAPALGLAAVLLAPKHGRWWLGLFIGLAGGTTSLSYCAATTASWPMAIALISGRAILWMWMLRIAARAAEEWRPAAAVFVLPVLLVGAETLISRLSPHGAAGSLAYSQMDFLTLLQLASWRALTASTSSSPSVPPGSGSCLLAPLAGAAAPACGPQPRSRFWRWQRPLPSAKAALPRRPRLPTVPKLR